MKQLILFALLIVFHSCNMNNNNKAIETKIYSELNKSFKDTLRTVQDKGTITKMELEISGNITGKGKLTYSHVPFIRKQTIDLEGSINKKIETDWYDERCLIKYEPENPLVTGEITIKFTAY